MQQQQQATMEATEDTVSVPPTYDETFPVLPGSAYSTNNTSDLSPNINNNMRIGVSYITKLFRVPFEERKFDNTEFGEIESVRMCKLITKETGAQIEINSPKDQSINFVVSGKRNQVDEAHRRIMSTFQAQTSKNISIPKEHHRWILGKQGSIHQELQSASSTRIIMPSMLDQSDNVTIMGTRENIKKAESDIRRIIEEQLKKSFVKISVPKIYYPFILGAYNQNLQKIMNETGATIHASPMQMQNNEMSISGETESVRAAKQKIESIYKDMEQRCTTVSVEVPKQQHKYVSGYHGNTLAEILRLTGVSVEVPPADQMTDTITLRGPHDKLGLGLSKVYEKANSMKIVTLDAPAWIHKYIMGPKRVNLKKFKQDSSKLNFDFDHKDNKIRIEGPPEEVEKVQKEFKEMIDNYTTNYSSVYLNVDQKYYKHIIGKNGARINRMKEKYGVHIQISENSDEINIDGPIEGVKNAQQELMEKVEKMENEKEKDIIIESKYYRNIIGSKGENIKEIKDKFKVQIIFPNPGEKVDIVKIRGIKQDVDQCYEHLTKLVKDIKESDEIFKITIYKRFKKYLETKKGSAMMRKLADDTHTKIDVPAENDDSDVIVVTGKWGNVFEVKDKILKLQQEVTPIVTEEIEIPEKLLRLNKKLPGFIDDSGAVEIKFPQIENLCKIIIKGPKEDVEKAKQQINDINIIDVKVKTQHYGFIIGKHGVNIKRIRELTGTLILFPTEKDKDKEIITIIGKKEDVEKAKDELEQDIKNIESKITIECSIPKKHHQTIKGPKGCNIQSISNEFNVKIKFLDRTLNDENKPTEPINGENGDASADVQNSGDIIRITGLPINVEAAKQALFDLIPIEIEVEVPFDFHGSIIGLKGKCVKELLDTYNVQIKVSSIEEKLDYIKISGTPANVELAKQAILEKCKVLEAERQDKILKSFKLKIPVDLSYFPKIIGPKGATVNKIRRDHNVQIAFPQKGETEENMITIIGYEMNTHAARDDIMKIVHELDSLTKEEVRINSAVHSRIIGLRGRKIREIMKTYNVEVKIPSKTDPDLELVTIIGSEEQVAEAKEYILQLETEFLQELEEIEYLNNFRVPKRDVSNPLNGNENDNGFVVKGAPWEQQSNPLQPTAAPNTASVEDFPQIAGSNHVPSSAPDGAWGPKR